jgi:hypothetical protein
MRIEEVILMLRRIAGIYGDLETNVVDIKFPVAKPGGGNAVKVVTREELDREDGSP